MHIRKKTSSMLPQLQNHCNVYSDHSSEAERLGAANTSSHKNKESSFKTNQSDWDIYDRRTSESRSAKDSLNLIDLNRALLCIPDFNCTFISDSEVTDLDHPEGATSDLQTPSDVREAAPKHNQDLHSKSQGLQRELNSCDRWRIINTRSIASLLPDEISNISDRGMIGLPLNSRGDGTMNGKAPHILPHHTIQCTGQFSQNRYTNMNLGNIHHTGREFSSCPWQNQLHAKKPRLHSGISVQHEHAVISQHTMRLMGKDLTVSTAGGKCIGDTAKEHASSSIRCHHTTNIFLELPRHGHPFLSLQSRSFSNIQVDAPSTTHDYVGCRVHHLKHHRFPGVDVFSGNGIECEDKLRNFSYFHCGQNSPAGFSPLRGNRNTRSDQNSQSATAFLPTFMPHVKHPSFYHANSAWTHNPCPGNIPFHPSSDGTIVGKEQNQITGGVAEIPRAVDIVSRDTFLKTAKAHFDSPNISSGVRCVPRSGPVKLHPGAKHVLEPRQNTDDGNYPPKYSCIPFVVISRGGNILSGQTKDGRKV
uniref:Uncharacterized protein n=2 Tax=Oryza brachyantha TaxID=4533 RepID=J3M4U1_ORYBR